MRPDPDRGPLVVLGHTGQLGQALMRVAERRGWRALGVSRRSVPGLSLARLPDLAPWFKPLAPALVINAAAITDLGAAEADPMAAMELHARLPGLLADWGRATGTPWVQLSTDQYWRGEHNELHDEAAPTEAPNVYARSLLEGEALALRDPGCLLLRTHIVGFRGRAGAPTFVEAALAALARGEPFEVCNEVWASRIEAHQFAEALFDLVEAGAHGRLNLAAREATSEVEFVEALAHATGHDAQHLRRVRRPTRSRLRRANATGLDVARAEALLGRALPTAAEVVDAVVASPGMPRPSLERPCDLELA